MNIYLDNVNLGSSSGPNHFASKLRNYMSRLGDTFNPSMNFDVQLSFIQKVNKVAPLYQRLDGIYFNSSQDFESLNRSISETYKQAKGVIFQSQFNKELTFKYFGKHDNYDIIHNGADLEFINGIEPLKNAVLEEFDNVWCCASSWRPHKRLRANIEYFLQHSGPKDCMVVAGRAPVEDHVKHDRVFYVGDLDVPTLYSLYKKSKYFVHLAFLDHCPNVVVDAVACGCHIICSSSGGTKEIAVGGTIILEEEWDYSPLELYNPPEINFANKKDNNVDTNIDMTYVASRYHKFMGG